MTYYPLTTPQQNIWNLQKYYEHTAIGNIAGMITFAEDSSYDMPTLLEQAINYVIKKNDSLRIRLVDDGGTIKQYFLDYVYEKIPVKDYSAYAQEEVLQILQQESEASMTMLGQPLCRFSIIKCKKQYSVFMVIHHLICDGWTSNLLANEVSCYIRCAGKIDAVESHFTYTQFIDQERNYRQSRRFERDVAYWDAFAQEYSELSYINPQMSVSDSIKASRYVYTISQTETEQIYKYCASSEISPDALYKTAMAIYLYKLNHVSSVVMGTLALNRDGAAAKNTVGMYVSTMPVELRIDEIANVRSHIDQCISNTRNMFRHCKYSYSDILTRTKRYHSDISKLFDVMISYENSSISNDAVAAVHWFPPGYCENALTVHIDDRNSDGCLDISYDYQVHLFRTEKNIELLAKRIQFIIQQMIDDDERTVSDIQIVPAEEYNCIINNFNDTAYLYPRDACMHVSLYSLVEKQLAGRIIDGNQEHSLAELRHDAEKIDAVVHSNKRTIGVLCERSYAELAAIYGIIRGGNAYLPISPDYPPGRIQLLLEQSNCKTVLAQRKYRHLVPDALVIEEILEGNFPINVPAISALPDDPLYVIFTSGSTGTPKGAMVSNRSAVNRIRWMCDKYFSPETVVMLKTPFTFDVSVWEIFGFALGGFSLYILPPEDHYRQDRVAEHIRKGSVTDLHFVPTVFSYFLDALKKDGASLPSLKNIFLSGEALSASLVNRAPATVHNLYGPTECAVDVTYYDCAKVESDPVPIGRPIDNCQMYVLDEQLQPLPIGIVGQIFIGGTPVGLGYINDEQKTSDVFVPNPYAEGRLYRTGDLGYWREDGELIFVGRADHQVKIRGQRIELGEIEAALNTFVPASVVVVEADKLIAFYTGDECVGLREQLSRILPHHMIPNQFVRIETMPMTTSGKIDRKALLMLPRQGSSLPVAPATHEGELLLSAVKEALQLSTISINDNFYELGGDSLSALSVITSLQDWGYDLSVTDFLKSETLELAAGKMNRLAISGEQFPVKIAPVPPIVKAYQHEKQNGTQVVEIGELAGHHPQGIIESTMKRQQEMLVGSSSELDDVLRQYSLDDVYDLTPAQLGMYRNWEHYYLYYTIKLGEKVDIHRLEKAVSLLAKRHPILRSKFVELSDGSVKQLILKDWQPNFDFDNLFRVKPNGHNLTVETHHIILDGWSLTILARDMIAYYHSPETSVSPTTSFDRYSQWLHTQPTGLPYWKALLSGCGVSSDLPHVSNSMGRGHELAERLISAEGIAAFAKAHRVSINTVLETAFAMLFRSNATVLFSKVISGRNAPIFGIDEIVGPFVNMVPVYVKSNGNILAQIHEQSIMTNEFGFTPLAELYTHTDLRRINILFVFDNFPSVSTIPLVDYKEENEFDLTVSIRETEDGYMLRASYAPEKYERSVIEEMIRNFEVSLKQLLSNMDMSDSLQMQALSNYEAPVGEIESTICQLFERVIGTKTVGRHDNYYDLGGTSLNMMELLCEAPLDAFTPSDFMQNPTPAGLARLVISRTPSSLPIPLYTPENATAAYVLFPYGGGDAAAYTALVAEFRKRNAPVALLFVPWGCDYDIVADNMRAYPLPLYFYSHCAGAVIAMKLLDRVKGIKKYIAGASVPPEEMQNIWPSVPNEMLLSVLYDAGMPKLPNSQEDAMLRQFRENTDEYFCYFSEKKCKTPAGVTLVLSREDIFTRSYPQAAELWNRYIERFDAIHYMESTTHYFQSMKAFELAEILLKEVSSCCKR